MFVFLMGNMLPVIFFHTHFTKEYSQRNCIGNLHIYMNGKHMKMRALVDTGNRLYEPITGKPVCLVEYQRVRQYLDFRFLNSKTWLIPYRTIGNNKGMLWGVTADKVIFQNKWRKKMKSGCILALYKGNISQSGEVCAIVHPDIFEK